VRPEHSLTRSSCERARAPGAARGIHQRTTPAWHEAVLALTGGRGVDHAPEVGGPGTFGRSLKTLASGGHLALIGVLTGFGPPDTSPFPLVGKNADHSGI
jgi:NADPH:quinone reductase-like Zn-dependent oxidoreductase